MSPPAGKKRLARGARQTGFSLVAAVFLIVVLAALAAFAVQIAMTQSQGANMELLEAQAQAAAEAGIEYEANIALQGPGTCRANTTLRLNQPGLPNFVVRVGCTRSSHQIGAGPTTYYVYALTSTASHGNYGGSDYVARNITRNVNNAPP